MSGGIEKGKYSKGLRVPYSMSRCSRECGRGHGVRLQIWGLKKNRITTLVIGTTAIICGNGFVVACKVSRLAISLTKRLAWKDCLMVHGAFWEMDDVEGRND
ncbi:hypothetical protein BJX64DRAFT_267829 [Aspergillus heterothallicus]